jgi:hypothetical protein
MEDNEEEEVEQDDEYGEEDEEEEQNDCKEHNTSTLNIIPRDIDVQSFELASVRTIADTLPPALTQAQQSTPSILLTERTALRLTKGNEMWQLAPHINSNSKSRRRKGLHACRRHA